MTVKKWEIHWAHVVFEDSDEVKRRPVLIIDESNAVIISFKMTGTDRGDNVREYRIEKWQEAGLSKPTSVRLDKILHLQKTDLDGKIGRLQEIDIIKIRFRLSKR